MVSGRRCYAAGCIEPIGSLVRLSIISSLDYSDFSSHPRLSRDSAHCVLASFKEEEEEEEEEGLFKANAVKRMTRR
jgi:hypothetical protein